MAVSFRQLEGFLAVCDEHSFSKAANRIHISPSGLSVLIRELESSLGVRLFDRSTRHVQLTHAGEAFRAPAARLLTDLARAVDGMRLLEAREQGRVCVAAPSLLAARLLIPVAELFRADFPGIRLDILDIPPQAIVQGLHDGRIDIGFGMFRDDDVSLVLEPLLQGPTVALLPRSHPLAGRRSVSWAQIASAGLILQPSGQPLRADMDRLFQQAGVTPTVQLEASQLSTIIAMVEAGFGVTIMPPYVSLLPASRKTVARPLVAPRLQSAIVMAEEARRTRSAAAQAFVETAHKAVRRMKQADPPAG